MYHHGPKSHETSTNKESNSSSSHPDFLQSRYFLHKSCPILGAALDSEELYPTLHSSFLKVIFRGIY